MDVNEMQEALKQARQTDYAAEQLADDLALYVLRHLRTLNSYHLRTLNSYRLKRLKMQLRNFNARTLKWNDE